MTRIGVRAFARRRLALAGMIAIVFVIALGGCKPPPPELSTVERVQTLLVAGRIEEALTAAQSAGEEDRVAVGRVLADWGRAAPAAKPVQAAQAFVAAIELDPTLDKVYTDLVFLIQSQPQIDDDLSFSRRAHAGWQAAQSLDDTLLGGHAARRATAHLALRAGDAETAVQLYADVAEEQFGWACRWLREGKSRQAAICAAQIHAVLGDRPDLLALMAAAGVLPPLDVEVIADVGLPETMRSGRVAAVDGDLIYVLHYSKDVFAYAISTVSAKTGEVSPVITQVGGAAAPSPDGRLLAYSATGPERHCEAEVCALDLATGQTKVLIGTVAPVEAIAWSPDGQILAVTSYEGLLVVPAAGGGKRLLVPLIPAGSAAAPADWNDEYPLLRCWLTDGSGVVYQWLHRTSGDMISCDDQWVDQSFVIDLASGKSIGLGIKPEAWRMGGLVASPDGQHVAAAVSDGRVDMDVQLLDLQGGTAASQTIIEGAVFSYPVSWSPDGRQLLIYMALCSPGSLSLDGSETRVIIPGRCLAYPGGCSVTSWGPPSLWIYDTLTGNLGLLPTPDRVEDAAWANDGAVYLLTYEGRLCAVRLP